MSIQWIDTNQEQFGENDLFQWTDISAGGYTYSQIFSDGEYIYNSYDNILEIYDLQTQTTLNTGAYDFYITALWANQDYLFIGTLDSGVYYLNKSFIPVNDVYDNVILYEQYPSITSNYIRDMHGRDKNLAFCTDNGVDFFKLEPDGYKSFTSVFGVYNVFVYSERELYYTVSGTNGWDVYKEDPITDWETQNAFIPSDDTTISLVNKMSDLKVNKNKKGETIVFLLTDVGIDVINYNTGACIYIMEQE